jgi:hypothetical protein
MGVETKSATHATGAGLARLCLLLLASTVAIAGFWHLMYGVRLVTAMEVGAEIGVLLALAFVFAWRWSR